ncbi:MAG: AAA family ATPase [Bdellovibrionota bacterium]
MSTLLVSRYLKEIVLQDLTEKMVFLGGPRQVGKTTFSQSLIKAGKAAYLNWDDVDSRERILSKNWSPQERLVILDEIHKYAKWRNLVKGFFDTQKHLHSFLVTGSARLDHYRKGGDSLLGRYHYYRLHPFSLPELGFPKDGLNVLLKFGGFPEPFLKQSERTLRRWNRQRLDRLIREDLRDLERVQELTLIQRLAEALPGRVGSILSIKNLSQTFEIDFKTAKRWLEILENLYFSFRVSPYGTSKIRAVKKEQKLYLWDWSSIESPGARFENLVASHLLKYCHYQEDYEGYSMELRFLRDIDKREIDFVVLKEGKPIFAVECKTGEKSLAPHIPYFLERTSIPKFYQVHQGSRHTSPMKQVEILPFPEFCKIEGMV